LLTNKTNFYWKLKPESKMFLVRGLERTLLGLDLKRTGNLHIWSAKDKSLQNQYRDKCIYLFFSYMISVGIVDKLTQYFRSVQGPVHDDKEAAEFLPHGLGLLVAVTKFMSKRYIIFFNLFVNSQWPWHVKCDTMSPTLCESRGIV
jgi:hypothetical protein